MGQTAVPVFGPAARTAGKSHTVQLEAQHSFSDSCGSKSAHGPYTMRLVINGHHGFVILLLVVLNVKVIGDPKLSIRLR